MDQVSSNCQESPLTQYRSPFFIPNMAQVFILANIFSNSFMTVATSAWLKTPSSASFLLAACISGIYICYIHVYQFTHCAGNHTVITDGVISKAETWRKAKFHNQHQYSIAKYQAAQIQHCLSGVNVHYHFSMI